MPHEKRIDAEREARQKGIDVSQVVKSEKGYYIAPQGLKTTSAKMAYAKCRAYGGDKEKCAKIAWSVEKKVNK